MNKADLVNSLAEHEGVSKAQAERWLDTLTKCVMGALCAGRKVILPGLGHLEPVTRKERKGRNPRTGDAIDIQAKRSVKFQPGKALKDALTAWPSRIP